MLELLLEDELDLLLDELDDPVLEDPLLAEPELDVPVLEFPVLDVPVLDVPVLDEPVLDVPVLAAACVAPGSMIATTPATAALAIPTVAVVTFIRRRPRSRSATARDNARVPSRVVPWPRDSSLRN